MATSNQQRATSNQTMSTQLIDTVAEALELSGAAVEKSGEYIEALIPPETATILHTNELARLYFSPDQARQDGELVNLQSDFLDRLFALMQNTGNYAQLSLQNLYLKQSTRQAADQRFQVLNGLGQALDAIERRLAYLQFNFKYTAVSDEKKEGLVSAIINEHTLANASDMIAPIEWAEFSESSPQADLPAQPFENVYAAASRAAEAVIHRELAEFHKSLNRRLQRDIGRLTEYYQSLAAEVRRKIERRGLAGKERDDEEARIRATTLELERKLTDQREKYAMKVNVEPINLLRLVMPVMAVNFSVRFRKAAREMQLIWNPLTKDFEALVCQGCAAGVFRFFICAETLHVVCAHCFKCANCQRNICRACHPGKCPKCGHE